MTNFLKRTITLATLATILVGTALGTQAQAARVVPAPQRCYTPQQVGAVMAGQIAKRLYLQTYRHHYTGDNNERVHGIGVKKNDQWFSFEVEMCKGSFVRETPLPGRPSNL